MQVICNRKSTQEVRARADREVLVESGVGETPLHDDMARSLIGFFANPANWLSSFYPSIPNIIHLFPTRQTRISKPTLIPGFPFSYPRLPPPSTDTLLNIPTHPIQVRRSQLKNYTTTRYARHWQSRSPFKLKLQPPTHKQAIGLCMLHPPGSPPFTLQITLDICSWIASATENDSTGLPSITIAQTTLTANAAVVVSYYPDENFIRTLSDNGRRNHCFGMLLDCHGPLQNLECSALFDIIVAVDTPWNSETHVQFINTLCMCLDHSPSDARI
ncbi:hypothetical protein DFJ58DRAFT_870240 [Suillus subalutaceus]|uniref:uncharacterized protein n=1 Tax=Suillus subalutaceus TaxID=48586 RepID=UPI001B879DE5|nr:uncharacterized protein DFJ58DRAFT_870240 [Suillus subalutaceus]KAG1832864.1 hypothetical protein DFJ58DRAFT_870240 [Suillus subalutaceus]